MTRPAVRYCACGCGRRLEGRADKRYLNATHRKRAERARTQPVSVTSVTGPYPDTDPGQNVTDAELIESRLQARRGLLSTPAQIEAEIYRLCALLRDSKDPDAKRVARLLYADLEVALGPIAYPHIAAAVQRETILKGKR